MKKYVEIEPVARVEGHGDIFLEFEGDKSIFNASPAISNGRLLIRSNEYLYSIGKK